MDEQITIGWAGMPPIESPVWQSKVVDREVGERDGCDVVVVSAQAFAGRDNIAAFCKSTDVPCVVFAEDTDVAGLSGLAGTWLDLIPAEAGPEYLKYRLYRFAESTLNQRDALTGVLDRRSGIMQALRMMQSASSVSAIMVDLDHFKKLNDTYGHAAGDEALKRVGATLQSGHQNGIVARFGGEEFMIVLPCDEAQAVKRAELMRQFLSELELADEARTTGSFGAADNSSAATLGDLLRNAEEALYAAKASGRNRTVRYSELERQALQSGEDVAITALETRTRVLTDRMANYVTMLSNRLLNRARKEAETDGLTGVYNRRYLDKRLQGELTDQNRRLAVALFDLDHFGQVNKQHGWPSGDKVLKDAVEAARSVLREGDWIGRYGGEEFCVVLPNTGVDAATEVMERLRLAVEQQNFESTNGVSLAVTASVGVVERNGAGESAHDLLERVSQLALLAKQQGRNQVVQESAVASE